MKPQEADSKEADDLNYFSYFIYDPRQHSLVDMAAYDDYFSGKMQDVALSESDLKKAMADLPKV